MRSSVTRSFRKTLAASPPEMQKQAAEAYKRWQADPSPPGLQFKPVSPSKPIWSARVGRDYRAVALREKDANGKDVAMRFWLGPHDEYDRLLKRLRYVPRPSVFGGAP